MEPKTLVIGTMYLKCSGYDIFLNYWLKLIDRFSCDWLLIDSASPQEMLDRVDLMGAEVYRADTDDLFDYKIRGKRNVISFKSNIGHLGSTGKDGWGRALCQGLKVAIDNNYDYVVHIESDLLIALNVPQVVERMQREGIQVLTNKSRLHKLLETGLMFMSVDFLKKSGFINNYKWQSYRKKDSPEKIIEKLFGAGNIVYANWNGDRNEKDQYKNIHGLDYITHCPRIESAHEFFAMVM